MAFAGERQKCGSGPCCGEGDCSIFSDTFDRADGDSLGADWTEVAGDFDIASNQLSTTTANSLAVCNTAHPDSLTSAYAEAVMVSCGSGSVARVIVNYVDANNYHSVNVTCNSSSATIVLIKRTGGSNTTLGTINVASGNWTSNVAMTVCMSPVSLSCKIVGPSTQVHGRATTPHSTGYKAGIGSGTVVTSLAVDGFSFEKRNDETHGTCNDCPTICGPCCDPSIPPYPRYRIDMGAGGWTDVLCDFCDQIMGEYYLDATTSCEWLYLETGICDMGCDPTACQLPINHRITLTLVDGGFSGCFWQLSVGIGFTFRDASCACATVSAIYRSSHLTTDFECRNLPVTLTKISDNAGSQPLVACDGALPGTVTLEAA